MALKLLANNNAKSVLAAGISASATVITVGTGTGLYFHRRYQEKVISN